MDSVFWLSYVLEMALGEITATLPKCLQLGYLLKPDCRRGEDSRSPPIAVLQSQCPLLYPLDLFRQVLRSVKVPDFAAVL